MKLKYNSLGQREKKHCWPFALFVIFICCYCSLEGSEKVGWERGFMCGKRLLKEEDRYQ